MRRALTVAGLVFAVGLPIAAAADRYGLSVAPRAVDVDWKALGIQHSVSYSVPEAYPATDTLVFIEQSLAAAGWRPATCDDLGRYACTVVAHGGLAGASER